MAADITVGDDVWIGFGAIILSGVTIGTGSIVAKDVPPYSIYIGNKVIKSRFTGNVVSKLMRIDWNTIIHNKGDGYECYVNTKIDEDNIEDVLEAFLKK